MKNGVWDTLQPEMYLHGPRPGCLKLGSQLQAGTSPSLDQAGECPAIHRSHDWRVCGPGVPAMWTQDVATSWCIVTSDRRFWNTTGTVPWKPATANTVLSKDILSYRRFKDLNCEDLINMFSTQYDYVTLGTSVEQLSEKKLIRMIL